MEQNEFFEASTISSYLVGYAHSLHQALLKIDPLALKAASNRIQETAAHGGTIYVAGNGGSAAISEHLMCDFMKGSALKVRSLVSNVALLTAIANDVEYEDIFVQQLAMLRPTQRDLLFLISSSGNSPNVVRVAHFAKRKNIPVIGLTGFSGGKLRKESDVSLHINVNNYGVVEDAHQALMHVLAHWGVMGTIP